MNIVFELINATISFFTYFRLICWLSNFDVRKYNGSCFELHLFPPSYEMLCTTFIDESAETIKSMSSTYGGFKILPSIARKILLEQKYIFFVITRFSCLSISLEVFKKAILFSFAFQICYIFTKLFYRQISVYSEIRCHEFYLAFSSK